MKGNAPAAILLILAGAYFLLSNLGFLNINIRDLIGTWWPVALIATGVSMLLGRRGG